MVNGCSADQRTEAYSFGIPARATPSSCFKVTKIQVIKTLFRAAFKHGGERNGLLIIASAPQSFQSLLARKGSFLPREVAICVRASGGQQNSQDLFDDASILTLMRQSDMGRINEGVINAIGCVSKSTKHLIS